MSTNRRVAVTSPQTRLARAGRRHRGHWRPSTLDPSDAERAIVVYRAQRNRAIAAVVMLFGLLLGLPALLAVLPWLSTVRLFDIPLGWLLLGLAPYPAMVLIARWQLRGAERVEARESREAREFREPREVGG